jgi:uncharacterized RDD family membrane protein YckC
MNTPSNIHEYPFHDVPMPERIGFPKRLLAGLVDSMLISILAIALASMLGSTILRIINPEADTTEFSIFSDTDDNTNDNNTSDANNNDNEETRRAEQILGMRDGTFAVLVVANSMMTAVYGLLELFTGASLGKRLLGIMIAFDTGERASRGLLLKRWCVKYGGYVFALIPLVASIGSIWNFMITCGFLLTLGASHQALHDMAVQSAVFLKKDIVD